ncbi:MAG TPA: DUF4410 domain-containing protein [Candidatus Binatia bacterium]|jgi:hypothetical protein
MQTVLRHLQPFETLSLALVLAGCATDVVAPRFPAVSSLRQPDRVLVYDFAATPEGIQSYGGEAGAVAQTEEEILVGKALAKALTDSLVSELRSRNISAYRASEEERLGDTTASIRGRLMHIDERTRAMPAAGFRFSSNRVGTRILIFQGAGGTFNLVAEADTETQTSLRPGMAAGVSGATTGANESFQSAVEADARRVAQAVADRIANYYRQQGWIK